MGERSSLVAPWGPSRVEAMGSAPLHELLNPISVEGTTLTRRGSDSSVATRWRSDPVADQPKPTFPRLRRPESSSEDVRCSIAPRSELDTSVIPPQEPLGWNLETHGGPELGPRWASSRLDIIPASSDKERGVREV